MKLNILCFGLVLLIPTTLPGQAPDLAFTIDTQIPADIEASYPIFDFDHQRLVTAMLSSDTAHVDIRVWNLARRQLTANWLVKLPHELVNKYTSISDIALVGNTILINLGEYSLHINLLNGEIKDTSHVNSICKQLEPLNSHLVLLARLYASHPLDNPYHLQMYVLDIDNNEIVDSFMQVKYEGIRFKMITGHNWIAHTHDRIFLVSPLSYKVMVLDLGFNPIDSFCLDGFANRQHIRLHDSLSSLYKNNLGFMLGAFIPLIHIIPRVLRFQAISNDSLVVYRIGNDQKKSSTIHVDLWVRQNGQWQPSLDYYQDKKPRKLDRLGREDYYQRSSYSSPIKRRGVAIGFMDIGGKGKEYGMPYFWYSWQKRMRMKRNRATYKFYFLHDD